MNAAFGVLAVPPNLELDGTFGGVAVASAPISVWSRRAEAHGLPASWFITNQIQRIDILAFGASPDFIDRIEWIRGFQNIVAGPAPITMAVCTSLFCRHDVFPFCSSRAV